MQNVYSVGQINSYIKNMFAQDYLLQAIHVCGEVSNCKYHSSGHIYFTLKDKLSVINCIMFAGNRGGLSFPLKEGMQVVVSGKVDTYERDGKYQLYAKKIVLNGVGQLYEKYEKLKRDLEERGLFAKEYKQPIPEYVKTLGVVTAKTGAAVRDIIDVAKRRNPYIQIVLYEAIVQGERAAASIVKGIQALERLNVDVMIVGRGGGSIEELWAFNEEIVAQAVFDCSIPIISAVGHETDTTIIDYVSDLRAPTPSAAAELAVQDIRMVENRISTMEDDLKSAMARKISQKRLYLENYLMRLQRVSPENRIKTYRFAAMQAEDRLRNAMDSFIEHEKRKLAIYIERLRGLSPLDKLSQGFSYVSDEDGKTVSDVNRVRPGDELRIHVKNGRIYATVMKTEREG